MIEPAVPPLEEPPAPGRRPPRQTGRQVALALATLLLLSAPSASLKPATADETDAPRGPCEIRDDQLLAQPRLTLPAVSTSVTPPGKWSIRFAVLWSSSFAWLQDVPGEAPKVRDYLIDGDAVTADATIRRGLAPGLDVAVRLPLRWRGGGSLDVIIDNWHGFLHLPQNNRPDFRRNAFRVDGLTTAGESFSWDDRTGLGVGDLETEARWRVRDGGPDALSVAFVGRLSFPTASPPFDQNGLGAAGQVAFSGPLAHRLDAYAGLGMSAQAAGPVFGVDYAPTRAHAFLALEWRPARTLSLIAETDAATRLVTNLARYPGVHWLLNVTGRYDLARRARIDLGFSEGLISQDATTDFALHFAVSLRP